MKRFRYLFALALLASAAAAPVFSAVDVPAFRRIGLYVGSNSGGQERVTLAYAASDARSMAEVMNELGAVSKSDTIILTNPAPAIMEETFSRIRRIISDARGQTKRIEFLMYYSGHSDEQGLLLGNYRYGYAELRRNIEETGADVKIAILDSCSSGAFTRVKGGVMRQPFLVDESVNTQGYAFLTSSSEDEASQESDRIGASFFTYYFVSALRGAADNTLDGKVTLNEAYSYASSETLARTANTQAGPQHPSYDIKLTGSGDLVLTDLRITTSALQLDSNLRGKLYLRDAAGRLVAEVRKPAGTAMTLSLPSGRYAVDLESGDALSEAEVVLSNDYSPRLSQWSFTPVLREGTRSRGGAADESLQHVNGYFSFFPTLPLMENRRIVHGLSISAVGDSYGIDGFDLGLASVIGNNLRGAQIAATFGVVGGDIDGVQASGVFNIGAGQAKGAQAAGVFNIADGDVNGAQLGGVFNVSGSSVQGGQAAGVFNVADGNVRGAQSAGVFNISGGSMRGLQAAGVFNVGGREVNGVQAAGVFNISGQRINGAQAAGVFNVGGDVRGAQFSVVNVGGRVQGIQVGVVNIAREMHGLPIGLVSISGNGLHNPSVWTDGLGYGYAGLQIGSGAIYTLAYAGIPVSAPTSGTGAFGLGLGLHLPLDAFWLDLDLSAKHQMDWTGDSLSILTQIGTPQTAFPSFRASVGYKILGRIALFGGLALETDIPGVIAKSIFHSGTPWVIPMTNLQTSLDMYPQWFIGLRLSIKDSFR